MLTFSSIRNDSLPRVLIRLSELANRRRPSLTWQLLLPVVATILAASLIAGLGQQFIDESSHPFSYHALILCVACALIVSSLLAWILLRRIDQVDDHLRRLRRMFGDIGRGRTSSFFTIPMEEDTAGLVRTARRLHERVEKQRGLLEKENVELNALLESMSEGILLVDRQERLVRTNRASRELLGISAHAFPRLIHEQLRVGPLLRFVEQALRTQEPQVSGLSLDLGAQERQLHLVANPVRLKEEDLGVLVVIDDVTELRRLETLRKDFVSNVSHELRTPLTSIQGYLETLSADEDISKEDCRRFYESMLKQSRRLNEIFTDLLTLSRIEREEERGELTFVDESLDEIFSAVSAAYESSATAVGVVIEVEPCGLRLTGNFGLMQQAVANLVGNALKYAANGKRIVLRAETRSDTVLISVRDFGPGIPEEHRERIFERFYRIDKGRSRKDGGSGLGLAIVKHIAAVHKGRVFLRDATGGGCDFCIEIPQVQCSTAL